MKFVMKSLCLLAVLVIVAGTQAHAQRKGKKMTTPYFQKEKSLMINTGVYLFTPQRTTTVPLYLNPEMLIKKNIAVGLKIGHFQYKHFLQDSTPIDYFTEWNEEIQEVAYTHWLVAAEAKYFLNDIFNKGLKVKIPQQYGFYVGGFVGYNLVMSNNDAFTTDLEQETLRLGAAVGLKYQYSKCLGFFGEFTVNNYASASLGFTIFLGK